MKKIILGSLMVMALFSGCVGTDEVTHVPTHEELCYKGLIVVKMGYNTRTNGYFYERDTEGNFINCSSTKGL